MKLSLTLTAESEADNAKIIEVAAQFGGAPVKAAAPKAEKPAKTEKPAKAQEAVETEEVEEKPAKAEKPAKSKKAAAASEDEGPTIKDVRKVFGKLIDTLGDDDGPAAGKKLLKKYNAKQIPDIDKDYYGNVIEDAESLIAEAENTGGDEEEVDDLGIGDDGDDE